MAFPLSRYIKLPRLDALDQIQIYHQIRDRATTDAFAGGLESLIEHLDQGLRLIERARNLQAQWDAQRSSGPELLAAGSEASPRLVPLDQDMDRSAARLFRFLEQGKDSFGPASTKGRAALRLLHAAFPDGLGAHTRDTHAHQDVKNMETVAVLREDLYTADIALTGVEELVAEFEAAAHAFHEAYLAVQRAKSEVLPYSAVEEAETARHLDLLETLALVLSLTRDHEALRDHLVAPLQATLDARPVSIREARAAALGGASVDDTEGHEDNEA